MTPNPEIRHFGVKNGPKLMPNPEKRHFGVKNGPKMTPSLLANHFVAVKPQFVEVVNKRRGYRYADFA
ncbi:MAG: hypothetical protein J5769_03975, partial [Bacteroidales bacterium]|nr:hypothetical protein [Bacteroidales bacterium]